MKSLLLVLLLVSVSLSCSGYISQYVPAVVGNSGKLVNVTMELIPGNGEVYINVYPRTGLTTQDSIEHAITYARGLAKNNGCDILLSFGGKSTNYIEGPSAGTALTVMSYALFQNKSLRNDTIITGTIEQSGTIGPVGGLYEKAKGAASVGAKYFITPVENFYESLLLKNIEDKYDIKILQVYNVKDVIDFMIDNKTIEQNAISTKKRPIPELPLRDYKKLESFVVVAQNIIALEDDAKKQIVNSEDTSVIVDFFSNEIVREKSILNQGYVFTAANEAFLNYIDISTLIVITNANADLQKKKQEITSCLNSIDRSDMTDKNFEWVIGADLRKAWAQERLDSITIDDKMLAEDKYATYNDMMYADAWCHVSKELNQNAPSEGNQINESIWRDLAQKKINEANATGTTNDDTADKLKSAQISYANNHYGAAIYDAEYVISMESQGNNINNETWMDDNLSSLWGNIYQSQADFLYYQNQSESAYKTKRFATGLEEVNLEMIELAKPNVEEEIPESKQQNDQNLIWIVTVVLLFIILVIMVGRLNGNKRTGSGKTYRTQQKKG